MSEILEAWNAFRADPPPHVSIDGNFPESLLEARVMFAMGANIRREDGLKNMAMTFGELLLKFSEFRVGSKSGAYILQGTVMEGVRKKSAMVEMSIICADVDNGTPIPTAIAKVRESGMACVIATSHSHAGTLSEFKWDDFCSWRGLEEPFVTLGDAKTYVEQTGKLHHAVIDSIHAVARVRTVDGWMLHVHHGEMDKYRIVFLLRAPVDFNAYPNLKVANDDWTNAVLGLSKRLGIQLDPACKDSSRAYFIPAHPEGSDNHESIYLGGQPVDFRELVELGETLAGANGGLKKASVHKVAQGERGENGGQGKTLPDLVTPTAANKTWAAKYARRFNVVEALEASSPELLGTPAMGGKGRHLRECPYSERHSHIKIDDGSTFAVNASANEGKGFVIRCMHGGCSDVDRLDFLQRLIDDGRIAKEDIIADKFLTPDPKEVGFEEIEREFPLPNKKGKFIYVVR